jgi:hypothetical protein
VNFPAARNAYSRKEVRQFVEIAGFSQVAMRQFNFAKQMVDIENQPVAGGAFPSVKAATYAVWHKFYADRNRKWTRSDAIDIIIASAVPLVNSQLPLTESSRERERATNRIVVPTGSGIGDRGMPTGRAPDLRPLVSRPPHRPPRPDPRGQNS